MKTSESVQTITEALLSIEVPPFEKDKQGYGYNYVSIDSIVNVMTPLLKEKQIVIIQSPTVATDGHIGMTTRLQHVSGEYIEDTFNLPKTNMKNVNDTQAMGASITYGRRYGLACMLGIVSDDDTDGTVKETTKGKDLKKKAIEMVKKSNLDEQKKAVVLQNIPKNKYPIETLERWSRGEFK